MKIYLIAILSCVTALFSGTLSAREDESKKEARRWEKIMNQDHKNACLPGADVGIILDISKSIKIRNLKLLKQFLAHLVDRFEVSEEESNIGLIRFNRKVYYDFGFKKYSSNADVKTAIRGLPNKLGWQTRTDIALRKAETALFTAKGGDRPDRKNILFVFTDGKPTGQGKPNFEPVKDVADRLQKHNVTIVAAGYGHEINDEILKGIAGENGYHFMYSDMADFLKQMDVIVADMCVIAIDGQWTEWSQWEDCSVSCGGGIRKRSRTCTDPAPKYGGKDCEGKVEQTGKCRKDPCGSACDSFIDLGVIADVSKSVEMENLPKLKEALKTIADKFEISADGTHMGLITFARDAQMQFSFADTRYQDPAAAKKHISMINKLYFQTRTDKALIMADQNLFSEAGGDRPDIPNVLLVFTDGKPTPKAGYKDFDETVPPLEAKSVAICAIGIGDDLDEEVLKRIAGKRGNVIMVSDFNHLLDKLEAIKDMACEASKQVANI